MCLRLDQKAEVRGLCRHGHEASFACHKGELEGHRPRKINFIVSNDVLIENDEGSFGVLQPDSPAF